MLFVKKKVEKKVGHQFNAALINYYRDGKDYAAWHSDNEKELGPNPIIASLSFGESRRFVLRLKKEKQTKHEINLQDGDLLVMKGKLQTYWEHQLAKSAKKLGPRINITFRKIFDT